MKTLTIRNRGDDVAELMIYDVIGGDFFSEGVTAKDVRAAVKSAKGKTINLRINSPGGSVIEGAAILTALDEFAGRIEVDVDGVAASAASVIMMAGDKIRVASNGLVMVHNPYAMAAGGSDDMRRMADLLDKVKDQILDSYMRKAKVPREQMAAYMQAETWFTGAEAVEAGLADEAAAPVKMAALSSHRRLLAKLKFHHAPAVLTAQADDSTGSPFELEVGDYVQWLVEDESGLCAELEDGMIEEISEGTLTIPGTSLSLKGSAADPALRVCDLDDDESYWYLVRASQVRKAGDDEDEPTTTPMPGMGNRGPEWAETEARKEKLAALSGAVAGGAADNPFRT